MIQAIGQLSPDARHRGEQLRGIAFATQPLEHRQTAPRQQIANRARDALADAGERPQALEALLLEYLGYRPGQPPNRLGGMLICTDPEAIGTLRGQKLRDFFEPASDIVVQTLGHR